MSDTPYARSVQEFISTKEQFESLSRLTSATLEALEINPNSKRVGGFTRTCLQLGIESATVQPVLSMEESDGIRNAIAKAGIGAMTQKLFDLIRLIFNRLMGRGGHQLAEQVQEILTSIKENFSPFSCFSCR